MLNQLNRLYNLPPSGQEFQDMSGSIEAMNGIIAQAKCRTRWGIVSHPTSTVIPPSLSELSRERNVRMWKCSQLGWVWDLVMNLQNPHRLNNTIMRIKELFSIDQRSCSRPHANPIERELTMQWEKGKHTHRWIYRGFHGRHEGKNADKEGRILAAVDGNNR